MHKFIRDGLEDYLRGALAGSALTEFQAHLEECAGCRGEVAAMTAHVELLRLLHAPEAAPGASFCARVMQRVEAQRQASLPYALSQPALGWRLVFAAFTAVILMGSFLAYSGRTPALSNSSVVTIMAVGPEVGGAVGSDPQHDRETVLVSLASYQE
jgi:anti-sigma factor RsiW